MQHWLVQRHTLLPQSVQGPCFIWQTFVCHFTDGFAWRQGTQRSPLFQFTIWRGLRLLVEYAVFNITCLRAIPSVIKKYGECLNEKKNTVKDTLPLIPLKKTPPRFGHTYPNVLATFWSSSGSPVSVFSCAVVAASMSWIDSKRLPFMVILTLGKSQKSYGARSGE